MLLTRLAVRGYERDPRAQGKYAYRRELQRGGTIQIEFKNVKSLVAELTLVFLSDGKEVPACQLDAIDIADAVYELQG